jgi:hypothetical protein
LIECVRRRQIVARRPINNKCLWHGVGDQDKTPAGRLANRLGASKRQSACLPPKTASRALMQPARHVRPAKCLSPNGHRRNGLCTRPNLITHENTQAAEAEPLGKVRRGGGKNDAAAAGFEFQARNRRFEVRRGCFRAVWGWKFGCGHEMRGDRHVEQRQNRSSAGSIFGEKAPPPLPPPCRQQPHTHSLEWHLGQRRRIRSNEKEEREREKRQMALTSSACMSVAGAASIVSHSPGGAQHTGMGGFWARAGNTLR